MNEEDKMITDSLASVNDHEDLKKFQEAANRVKQHQETESIAEKYLKRAKFRLLTKAESMFLARWAYKQGANAGDMRQRSLIIKSNATLFRRDLRDERFQDTCPVCGVRLSRGRDITKEPLTRWFVHNVVKCCKACKQKQATIDNVETFSTMAFYQSTFTAVWRVNTGAAMGIFGTLYEQMPVPVAPKEMPYTEIQDLNDLEI